MISINCTKIRNVLNMCNSFQTILQIRKQNVPFLICPSYLSSKSAEEKLGLPEKPKKPLTPYFRYMKEIRPAVVADNPKKPLTDIVRLVAKKWETVDDNKKKQLEEEFKKDQIDYIKRRAVYESKLTDEQRESIKNFKTELSENREKKLRKQRIKDLGKPKRPASAFIKYLNVERVGDKLDSKITYKEWQKVVADKWKKLSDTEKEKYLKSAKNDVQKYRIELSKWEEKMIRLGNIDVVRHEALIEAPPAKLRRPRIMTSEKPLLVNSVQLSSDKNLVENPRANDTKLEKVDGIIPVRDTGDHKKNISSKANELEPDETKTWKIIFIGLFEPNYKEFLKEYFPC